MIIISNACYNQTRFKWYHNCAIHNSFVDPLFVSSHDMACSLGHVSGHQQSMWRHYVYGPTPSFFSTHFPTVCTVYCCVCTVLCTVYVHDPTPYPSPTHFLFHSSWSNTGEKNKKRQKDQWLLGDFPWRTTKVFDYHYLDAWESSQVCMVQPLWKAGPSLHYIYGGFSAG